MLQIYYSQANQAVLFLPLHNLENVTVCLLMTCGGLIILQHEMKQREKVRLVLLYVEL